MTATNLRRFLSLLLVGMLSIAPARTQNEPLDTTEMYADEDGSALPHHPLSPEEAAAQAALMGILEKVQAVEDQLTQPQMQHLMLLVQQYGSGLQIAFIDTSSSTKALETFLAQEKMHLSVEDALKIKSNLRAGLEKENISLELAQIFFSVTQEIQALQQRAQRPEALAPDEQDAQALPSDQSKEEAPELTEEEKLEQAKQTALTTIMQMGMLKNCLIYNPETDTASLEKMVADFNKRSQQQLTLAKLLEFRHKKLAELANLGVAGEQIKAFVNKNKKTIIEAMFGYAPTEQRDLITRDPATDADFFEKLSKKMSEQNGQDVPVATIIEIRGNVVDDLLQHGISLEEAIPLIKAIGKMQASEKYKHIAAACTSSALFGIADYFLQVAKTDKQVANSIWNWCMGTIGYYKEVTPAQMEETSWLPQHLKIPDFVRNIATYNKKIVAGESEWVWSKEGRIGRSLQMLGMIPTAYLYKNQTILPALKDFAHKSQGQLPPALLKKITTSKWLWLASFGLPALAGQHEEVAAMALQSSLGPVGGMAAHFACSKALPLALYAAHFYNKNKLAIKSLTALHKLIHQDPANALSHAGIAMIPVAEAVVAKPINTALRKITPKGDGTQFHHVFLRSFLNNNWGARLARIGTGALTRGLLYQQYRNTDKSWLKIDLGKEKTIRPVEISNDTELVCLKQWNTQGVQQLRAIQENTTFSRSERQAAIDAVYEDDNNFANIENTPFNYRQPLKGMAPSEFRKITGATTPILISGKVWTKKGNKVEAIDAFGQPLAYDPATDGLAPSSARNAALTHFKGALVQLATEEVVVATGTSALYAGNDYVVRMGKKVSQGIAWLAKKVGVSDAARSDWDQGISTLQELAKMGVCVIKMVMDTTSNPAAMVHNPQQLAEMVENITKNPKGLKQYTQWAQLQTHNQFATLFYNNVLKGAINKKAQATSYKDWFITEEQKQTSLPWTIMKAFFLTAAWLGATTTLAEPIKMGFSDDEFAKSFQGLEGLEEAQLPAPEAVAA